MNKKAVAWPVIIGGIAAIVIIATLIGPLKGVWHVVGERIFGTISPPSAEEFVPYVGPTAASIAENSFRAFICGSKIVYFNEVNFTTYCPDGMRVNIKGTNACSGVMYGNTCVECGNENKGANARLVCNVKHFELPEDAPYVLNQGFVVGNLGRITSWVSPAIAKSLFDYDNPVIPWLTGVGDPSYLMYYERFNEGEDVWWHVDAFSVNVMFIVTATVFNAIFGAGGASVVKAARAAALSEAAAMVAKKTMTKESFRELAKKSMILGVREVIERNIVVRGFRFFGRQLTKLFLRDTPEKATKAGMMRRVLVSMSEEAQAMLSPQGIDRIIDEGLLRKGFIAKNGALTISKDELKALIKKEAYDTTKLGITETEALIKDSSEKLLEQVSPLKGGRLWKNTLNFKNADEFYANFNRALSHSDEKIRTSLLKEAERGNFASALKQQDSQLYNRLTDGLRMKNAPPALKDDFINALATDAKKTIDDNVKLIEKKADDFAEKATMEIVEKYSGKITSEMIKEHNRVMAVVSYFEKYANADGTFNKMAFAKNLAEGDGKKMLDAFDKLPLEYQEKAIASAFETASAMGERDFQTIITNIGKAVEELEAKDKTLFSKLMDRLDSMIVHVEGYAKKVPYAGRGAVAIERATRWAAVKGGTVTYRSAKFVRDNRINLFILAYFIADWMDSRNEKFIDRGSYALVLNQPNMKLGNDIVEHLPENFSYITLLRDGDRAPIRFHMVSPCLTDLKIYGGTQTCVLNEDIYKYNLFDLEDTGKFPASRSKIPTPILSNSIIFKEDPSSKIDYRKIIDVITERFEHDVWYSIEELELGTVLGTPDWFYKLTADEGLYIMTGDEVFIYRYDPYYNAIFSEKWYDQYDYIAEKAKNLGEGQWHSGKEVGGFINWEYMVSGHDYSLGVGAAYIVMYARNRLTGVYQYGLGRDLGSKYIEEPQGNPNLDPAKVREILALSKTPSEEEEAIEEERPFLSYHELPDYLLKYVYRFENQEYPFFENAYKQVGYTYNGKIWQMEENINRPAISFENYKKRTQLLTNLSDMAYPLYTECVNAGKNCGQAAALYKQIIRLIVMDEHKPLNERYYINYLGQPRPIILQDQLDILNDAENGLADIYAIAGPENFKKILAEMHDARRKCLADIENGAVEETIDCTGYLGLFSEALENMHINAPNEPIVSLLENDTNLPFIQDKWYIFHRLAGVLRTMAIEIMAIDAYFREPAELQASLYALDKAIEDNKKLHDVCVETKNYSVCHDALEGYQNILYSQGAGYFEHSGIPIDQIEERMDTAEELMLDIFRSASDYRDIFEMVGIRRDYCSNAGKELFWCVVNVLKEETPYFSSLRATISKKDEAGAALMGVIASGSPLFGDKDYDIVQSQVRLNLFLEGREVRNPKYEHFWSSSEIALYVYYRNMDCIQAATIMSTIPAFAKLYGLDADTDGKNTENYATRCANGYNAIYPSYLEKKMIPFFSSRRPAMMYLDAFDKYAIPEIRRLEKDTKFSDDTYEELIEKNNYYQTKVKALQLVNAKQALFKKLKEKGQEDYRHWLAIQDQLSQRFMHNIVINGVRTCEADSKDSLSEYLGMGITKRNVKIPAIFVEPNFTPYKTDLKKANYCYSLPLSKSDRTRELAITIGGIFIDMAIEGLVYGATGSPYLARGAVIISGFSQAVELERLRLKRAWPGQNAHYESDQAK